MHFYALASGTCSLSPSTIHEYPLYLYIEEWKLGKKCTVLSKKFVIIWLLSRNLLTLRPKISINANTRSYHCP